MGERAHYITIKKGQNTIYYDRWGATMITERLFQGEAEFIGYVREEDIVDNLMIHYFIEAVAIIDLDNKKLFFSFSRERNMSSVLNYYTVELRKKWVDWQVEFMPNWPYDLERITGIDYVASQEVTDLFVCSRESFIDNVADNRPSVYVIVKNGNELFITGTGSLVYHEGVIALGEEVIALLMDKPTYVLPEERAFDWLECMIIDVPAKHIYMSSCCLGQLEKYGHTWPGYQFTMGNYGYLDTLLMAGIDALYLKMPDEEIKSRFEELIIHGTYLDKD